MGGKWYVEACFPWGPGREVLARCRTRAAARERARWEQRHPGTPREVVVRVLDCRYQTYDDLLAEEEDDYGD